MIIVLTGPTGSGKSTVCRGVIQAVRDSGKTVGGVLTDKEADGNLKVVDLSTGLSTCLASKTEGKNRFMSCGYCFDSRGIHFGKQAIQRGVSADLLAVDEIGPLEANGSGFTNIFGLLRPDGIKNVLLVIREGIMPAFKNRLGQFEPVRITPENRDSLAPSIFRQLFPND